LVSNGISNLKAVLIIPLLNTLNMMLIYLMTDSLNC
jgi:hypothetical protein